MIRSIELKAFGPIGHFAFDGLQNINLVIGRNGSGKTFLLKALYAALKSVEQHQRGKEPRSIKQLLAEALYWTVQGRELGNLVRKGEPTLSFAMQSAQGERLAYSFGSKTVSTIQNLESSFLPTDVNSVFIPAKEILSIQDVILRSYEVDKSFGFDKTYVDLAKALSKTSKGRNFKEFLDARKTLTDAIGGRLEYDDNLKEWVFRDDKRRIIEISLTSEGIKRLSILDLLLGNHFLTRESVVIIDEAEANLHPALVCQFMEILVKLAKAGLQIFLSSHSYFVIKSLYVLAHQYGVSIPVLSFGETEVAVGDLLHGMPDNPIVEESINIYNQEQALDRKLIVESQT